jgi:DDE superfamily endonuclease
MDLPTEILAILAHFAPLLSHRVWPHAHTLLLGAILVNGRRTVASALRIMGLAQEPHYTNYHRVLNRAAWSALAAARILLGLIVAVLPHDAPIILAADDTIERRNGRLIAAKGCYRDPVRSSQKHTVLCFGLKWVAMTVLIPVPWSDRIWALPFLTALSWPKGKGPHRRHKTSIDWVRQMVGQVRRWLPGRRLVLVVDGGFAAVALAGDCIRREVTMVCRLRLDAALYHPPGPQPSSKRGPKPKKGARQRTPAQWLARGDTPWESVEVAWYGGGRKTLHVLSRVGLWHARGLDPVAIRYLVVRDPEGEVRDAAYFCTDVGETAGQILGWVVQRWSMEVTFEEVRMHLGVETQRQWSDLAIARTTPVLLGLFSVVTLLALGWHAEGSLVARGAAWYAKGSPTFSDCIGLAREKIWRARISDGSRMGAESLQLPEPLLNALIEGLSAAA